MSRGRAPGRRPRLRAPGRRPTLARVRRSPRARSWSGSGSACGGCGAAALCRPQHGKTPRTVRRRDNPSGRSHGSSSTTGTSDVPGDGTSQGDSDSAPNGLQQDPRTLPVARRPRGPSLPHGLQCNHARGAMKARLAHIGNSGRECRMPKPLLEHDRLRLEVEFEGEGIASSSVPSAIRGRAGRRLSRPWHARAMTLRSWTVASSCRPMGQGNGTGGREIGRLEKREQFV